MATKLCAIAVTIAVRSNRYKGEYGVIFDNIIILIYGALICVIKWASKAAK